MFLENGFIYINPNEEQRAYSLKYYKALIFFSLPFISLLLLIVCIHFLFFYKLTQKNAKPDEHDYVESYEEFMRDRFYIFAMNVVFNTAFDVMITVPYVILNIYFNILLLVISLPFKNYPLNYYLGMAYGLFGF